MACSFLLLLLESVFVLFVFVFIFRNHSGKKKVLHYPSRYQKNKVFLKTAFALMTALGRNFITKGLWTGLIISDNCGSCVDFSCNVWTTLLIYSLTKCSSSIICCTPLKLGENSFKLLTSLVKNFSVDFKWNANSLTFFQTYFTAMAVYPL